ncbi:MAG: NAD(+)/NADH kinase [Calditrichia bacterium]
MKTSTFKKIFIQGNILKKQLETVIPEVIRILDDRNIQYCFDPELKQIMSGFKLDITGFSFRYPEEKTDLIITLGGDGTVLRYLQRNKPDIPVLPLNLGGLGFLTEVTIDEISTKLPEILEGRYYLDSRLMLETVVESTGEKYYSLNDTVIDKAGFPRIIFVHTSIDNVFFNNFVADGVIISTPTGSTGYSLSAGGPLISPQTEVLLLNPICPHSLTNRPVIIPSNQSIEIQVFTDHPHAHLVIDGQVMANLNSGDKIRVTRAAQPLHLVRHSDTHFFGILRSKLHWGEDLRSKERWAQNIKNNKKS